MARKELVISIKAVDQISAPIRRTMASIGKLGRRAIDTSARVLRSMAGLAKKLVNLKTLLAGLGVALAGGAIIRNLIGVSAEIAVSYTHLAKYGEDIELLLSQAGQGELRSRLSRRKLQSLQNPRIVKAALAAGEQEYQKYIKAKPGDVPGARAAKRKAIRAVRRDLIEKTRATAERLV